MLIRLMLAPASEHRRGADYVRQQVTRWEHFRRGNAPPLVFVMEAGWYMLVAVLFSSGGPRAAYLRGKRWVDRTAGAVMGLLGLRLIAG